MLSTYKNKLKTSSPIVVFTLEFMLRWLRNSKSSLVSWLLSEELQVTFASVYITTSLDVTKSFRILGTVWPVMHDMHVCMISSSPCFSGFWNHVAAPRSAPCVTARVIHLSPLSSMQPLVTATKTHSRSRLTMLTQGVCIKGQLFSCDKR